LVRKLTKRTPDRLAAWAGGINFYQCYLAGGGSCNHRRQVTQTVGLTKGVEMQQEFLHIDATPDESYPLRILQAYRRLGDYKWSDSSDGVVENNVLVKTMNDYNLDKTSVIAYRYDSEKKFVEDITQEVRGRVDGFRARKKMVSQIKSVSSSRNTGDILLAIDNNRETFWSSQIPYSLLMTVEVELKEEKRIAQIQIDSYNNKDQDKTSYRVELSVDKNNWEEVFYSQRYSSKGSGIKNLFFKPRFAKYIKIIQSGDHDYAPWVIHELKIFEVAN